MGKEKPATKICKHCKTEIPYGAKVCPQCRKKQGPGGCLIAIIVIVVIGLIGSCFGSGSNDDVKPVSTTQASVKNTESNETTVEPDTTTAASENTFGVGESVEQKNVIVTLNGITESNGSTYNKPADGNIFVLADFTIENNSDKELSVSSMLSFDAYQDGYSTSMSLSALMEKGNNEQLDGTIAPGKKMKGVVGYEIPKDYKELEINVQLDIWSSKKIVFVYTKE